MARKVFYKDIILFLKYFVFLGTCLISKVIVILEPIFGLGHYRLIDEVIEHNDFKFEKIFDDANSYKKYWISLMLYLIKMGIMVSGVWVIHKITKATVNLGIEMDKMTNLNYNVIQYIFLIPGIIIGILFVVLVHVKFAPTSYIIKDNEDIQIGEVIQTNFSLMNKKGIVSLLNIYSLNIIIIVIWGVLGYLLIDFTYTHFDFIILSIVKILVSFVLVRILVEKVLAAKISSVLLIEDLLIAHGNSLENEEEIDETQKELIALFESLPNKTTIYKNDKGEEL
ncbi:hypothetical protein [Haloplasma contractile]|uniref:hypothetical protein n=1 Tax=Haloplasma contractile TaxID=471825 RepID=UPI0002121D6D|nr:hypothetical protein [Haloplasma contractile]